MSVEEILAKSFAYGAVAGVVSVYLMAIIYGRLGVRAGGKSTTEQVIHILAYGGVPMAASVAIWVLTALLAGEPAFVETPRADLEAFLALLLHVQFIGQIIGFLASLFLALIIEMLFPGILIHVIPQN